MKDKEEATDAIASELPCIEICKSNIAEGQTISELNIKIKGFSTKDCLDTYKKIKQMEDR